MEISSRPVPPNDTKPEVNQVFLYVGEAWSGARCYILLHPAGRELRGYCRSGLTLSGSCNHMETVFFGGYIVLDSFNMASRNAILGF